MASVDDIGIKPEVFKSNIFISEFKKKCSNENLIRDLFTLKHTSTMLFYIKYIIYGGYEYKSLLLILLNEGLQLNKCNNTGISIRIQHPIHVLTYYYSFEYIIFLLNNGYSIFNFNIVQLGLIILKNIKNNNIKFLQLIFENNFPIKDITIDNTEIIKNIKILNSDTINILFKYYINDCRTNILIFGSYINNIDENHIIKYLSNDMILRELISFMPIYDIK